MCRPTVLHLPNHSRKLGIEHPMAIWKVGWLIYLGRGLGQYAICPRIQSRLARTSYVLDLLLAVVCLVVPPLAPLHHLHDRNPSGVSSWELRCCEFITVLGPILVSLTCVEFHEVIVICLEHSANCIFRLGRFTLGFVSVEVVYEDHVLAELALYSELFLHWVVVGLPQLRVLL